MIIKILLLGSQRPATKSGSRGAQSPFSDCSGDGSKRQAFKCHLPAVFRELYGQEIH